MEGTEAVDGEVSRKGWIDFHVHIFRMSGLASPVVRDLIEASNPQMGHGTGAEPPPGVGDEIVPFETMLAQLDAAGVERAVVLAQETPGIGINVPSDYVLEYCTQTDRLVPFVSLNIQTEHDYMGKLLSWAARGARGLKLYPSYQFIYPNDRRFYRCYELAEELGWPVVFHTGSSVFANSRLKYALPIHLDDVAADFPSLPVVLAHCGRPAWTAEATILARTHDKVYLEISGIPPHRLLEYLPDLPRISDKVIFGSDWPSTPAIGRTVQGILELGLSPEVLANLFVDTALSLLGGVAAGESSPFAGQGHSPAARA